MRIVGFLLLLLGTAFAYDQSFPLGGNVPSVSDYALNSVFVNQIKGSRLFGNYSSPWLTAGMTYDSNGWPLVDFGVIVVGANNLPECVGIWYVDWVGNATMAAGLGYAKVMNQTYDPITNKGWGYLNVSSPGSFNLAFRTHNNAGLTNLRAIRPGYDIVNPPTFTNGFLAEMAGLNTFRFMDWGHTNNNPITSWSQRTAPDHAQYTTVAGIPLEVCIELANTLNTNMWLNVPAMVDDDYVINMAQVLKDNLNSSLHVYIEYSNEVWNYQFQQATWALNQSKQMVNTSTWGPVLNYDNTTNMYYWQLRRTALRAYQISENFRSVWGDCAINDRVRVVLAFQFALPTTAAQGLNMLNAVYGPPNKWLYGIAGAPYFNLGSYNSFNNLTTDDVINLLNASSIASAILNPYNLVWARWYNLHFLAYEGGPDTFGPNSVSAKMNASLSDSMVPIITNFLHQWYAWGGELFNWYIWGASDYTGQYGTWGTTPSQYYQNTTKIQGLRQVQSSTLPTFTYGHILPTTILGGDYVGSSNTSAPWQYMGYGTLVMYILNEPHTYGAEYNIYFNYSAYYNSTFDILLNNQVLIANFSIAQSASINVPVTSQVVKIQVNSTKANVLGLRSTTNKASPFRIWTISMDVSQVWNTAAPVAASNCTGSTTGTSGTSGASGTSGTTSGSNGTSGTTGSSGSTTDNGSTSGSTGATTDNGSTTGTGSSQVSTTEGEASGGIVNVVECYILFAVLLVLYL